MGNQHICCKVYLLFTVIIDVVVASDMLESQIVDT